MSNEVTAGNEVPVTSHGEPVLCPMCEYDLRGLVEPRCPECGYRFDWDELRDPTRRLHPYLFEHHPRRNVRSFVQTLIGGLRPRRFWSTLHPTQPSRPGRLVLYFVFVCVAGVVPAIATYGFALTQTWSSHEQQRVQYLAQIQSPRVSAFYTRAYPTLTPQQIVDRSFPPLTRAQLIRQAWQRSDTFGIGMVNLYLILWPVLTLAAMMIFRISMRQARVRTVHVLRCVIYSADVIFLFNIALTAVLIASAAQSLMGVVMAYRVLNAGFMITFLVAWAIFAYRFTTAMRLYLRFDHPRLTVLATQIVAFLTLLVLILEIGYRMSGWG